MQPASHCLVSCSRLGPSAAINTQMSTDPALQADPPAVGLMCREHEREGKARTLRCAAQRAAVATAGLSLLQSCSSPIACLSQLRSLCPAHTRHLLCFLVFSLTSPAFVPSHYAELNFAFLPPSTSPSTLLTSTFLPPGVPAQPTPRQAASDHHWPSSTPPRLSEKSASLLC